MIAVNPDNVFINPALYMARYYRVAFLIDSYRTIVIDNDYDRKCYLNVFARALSELHQYEFDLMQSIDYPLLDAHASEHDRILEFAKSVSVSDDVCGPSINSIANDIAHMMSRHAENLDSVLNDYIKIKYYSSLLNNRLQ